MLALTSSVVDHEFDIFVGHENCRTKTSFIYTVENIKASYIVFFSAIITSTICLLNLS